MRLIDADTTRRALGFDRLVPTLRDAFAWGAQVPPMHVHHIVPETSSSHLDLLGRSTPDMREAAPSSFADTRVFVDTEEVLHKSGNLLDAVDTGTLQANRKKIWTK